MRLFPLLTTIVLLSNTATAQQPSWDSAVYNLHKFEKNIGKETYHITMAGGQIIYAIDFKFVDRGSPVPLTSTIKLNAATREVESFYVKGSTSRMSVINDSITIVNKQAFIRKDSIFSDAVVKPNTFPIAGYSPGTAQMLLIKYWKAHGQPKQIATLPSGNVQVVLDGRDNIPAASNNGKAKQLPVTLDRYRISGLVWGNEWVWTDKAGNLICLITNDAEGDKLEMMLEQYEASLPQLINAAAKYSMKLFAAQNKSVSKPYSAKLFAITNGDVVDVINKTVIKDATVLVENGKIKKVSTAKFKLPPGTPVIDATGKTILPGLWDMHAHFEQAEWGPAYLAAGITTVRDCGNEMGYIMAVQKAIDNGTGVGPHILKAGIIDGTGAASLGIITADNVADAITTVQRYKKAGFDQIKIYSSMKPEIVKAVCDEAHRLQLSVTGHIPEGMSLKAGIDSGMNQVNHIIYVYDAMQVDEKTLDVNITSPKSDSTLNYLLEHKTVIDPTIGVFELIFRSLKDSITAIEPNFYKLPLPLQTLFVNTGTNPQRAARLKGITLSVTKMVKAMYDKGIPIVAGTDMGMPGYSLYRELELYVQGGLTPLEALTTATIIPATVMNKQNETGSVTEGKAADIILVDGDPLANIGNLRKVSVVIKGGKVYDPEKLHGMAGFVK